MPPYDPAEEALKIIQFANRRSTAPAWGAGGMVLASAALFAAGRAMQLTPCVLAGFLLLPCALVTGLVGGRSLPRDARLARSVSRWAVALSLLGLLACGVMGTVAKFAGE